VSENWTCNFSSPRNESGIHGSGGIVGRKGHGMVKVDVSEEGRFPIRFLRVRASSRWAVGSLAAAHVASEEVESIRLNLAGDSTPADALSLCELEDTAVGISTGSGPLGRCPDGRPSALCEGYVPVGCGRFSSLYAHFETVLATTQAVHGRLASHFYIGFEG
jgi:hypothetical protein